VFSATFRTLTRPVFATQYYPLGTNVIVMNLSEVLLVIAWLVLPVLFVSKTSSRARTSFHQYIKQRCSACPMWLIQSLETAQSSRQELSSSLRSDQAVTSSLCARHITLSSMIVNIKAATILQIGSPLLPFHLCSSLGQGQGPGSLAAMLPKKYPQETYRIRTFAPPLAAPGMAQFPAPEKLMRGQRNIGS
jgi:hypothetical protein